MATRQRPASFSVPAQHSREWTRAQVRELYHRPLLDLVHSAQEVHRKFHNPEEVQLCRLLSIKTGGCPEDCAYCPQSAHYTTGLEQQGLMNVNAVRHAAEEAHAEGATRFC